MTSGMIFWSEFLNLTVMVKQYIHQNRKLQFLLTVLKLYDLLVKLTVTKGCNQIRYNQMYQFQLKRRKV